MRRGPAVTRCPRILMSPNRFRGTADVTRIITTFPADTIWQSIRAANAAWMRGEPEGVASLFAEDVVVIAPRIGGRIEGRAALVQSFVDYCATVRTHRFEEKEHSVEFVGDVAVAIYNFDVRYEYDGKTYDEQGQEMLVFAKRSQAWLAIWRTQVTLASNIVQPR